MEQSAGIMKEVNKKAVEKLKEKYSLSPGISPRLEEWHSIYDMLEVWDMDRQDPDMRDKTKYIWESLKERGEVKDQLLGIFSDLGSTPRGEKKIERVYRLLRLKSSAQKALQQYENIQNDIRDMRGF